MMLALRDGERVPAAPGISATCPTCHGRMVPKCGAIVVWHWAHEATGLEDCDPWSEGESLWHREWKLAAPPECREVTMGPHRADLKIGARVIELQHSALAPAQIREREHFYGPAMIWVWDARGVLSSERFIITRHPQHCTFRWKFPRTSTFACRQPVWLDLGATLFLIKKIYHDAPFRGWGIPLEKAEFIAKFIDPGDPRIERFRLQVDARSARAPVPVLRLE